MKEMWRHICKEVVGRGKAQHKEWISVDTMRKLDVLKEKKVALNTSWTRTVKAKAHYTATDKDVKKASGKVNRITLTNWLNRLKKQQDKESGENCI